MNRPLSAIALRLERESLLDQPVPPAAGDLVVREITTDSRRVTPGTLFCAVRGYAGDGHEYLADARGSGAVAALVEVPDHELDLPQLRVRNARSAAAFAAAELFRDPWAELVTIGVTGTNGKTTTVAMLRHLLALRDSAGSIGTFGVVDASGRVVPGTEELTTPGPAEAARWLRRLRDGGVHAVAMEASSHALDQDRLAAVRFDAALFTNLSRDHLDYHGTMAAYRVAKLRLLRLVKAAGVIVLNADDPAWAEVEAPGARVLRYAIDADADVCADDVDAGVEGTRWTLRTPDGSARVRLPLYGRYNVSNALAAAAVLRGLDWSTEQIAEGLSTIPQIPGRLERVATPSGAPTVVIDFAHTPDALERAIAALRPLVRGRLIVVFGAGGDRDRGKRGPMGGVVAAGADFAIVTSDNPRGEDPVVIADEIERGMGDAPRRRILDRREAIRAAIEDAGPDDLVLLAGKGHEAYQVIGSERRPFDERRIVQGIVGSEEVLA